MNLVLSAPKSIVEYQGLEYYNYLIEENEVRIINGHFMIHVKYIENIKGWLSIINVVKPFKLTYSHDSSQTLLHFFNFHTSLIDDGHYLEFKVLYEW